MAQAAGTQETVRATRTRPKAPTFEEQVVHQCAPTLAGIKPSSLFSFRRKEQFPSRACIRSVVDRLAARGVRLRVLTSRATGMLVFVYRPDAIGQVLAHEPSRAYLASCGYDVSSPEAAVGSMALRMRRHHRTSCACCTFPHEVGLLLGYPFDDVMAFLQEDCRRQSLCTGYWRVYSHEKEALECFRCYEECARRLDSMHANGTPVELLVRPDIWQPSLYLTMRAAA